MPEAFEEKPRIAPKIAEIFGGEPTVTRYYDRDETHEVGVAKRADCPLPGINSYSTITLSDYPLIQNGEESNTRLEILAACYSGFDYLANAISTAAFHIIKDQWFCAPGHAFANILDEYDSDILLPHLYFTAQFFWDKTHKPCGCRVSLSPFYRLYPFRKASVNTSSNTAIPRFLYSSEITTSTSSI